MEILLFYLALSGILESMKFKLHHQIVLLSPGMTGPMSVKSLTLNFACVILLRFCSFSKCFLKSIIFFIVHCLSICQRWEYFGAALSVVG